MTKSEALQFIDFILGDELDLPTKDKKFLESVKRHVETIGFISTKQKNVLQEIYANNTGGGQYAH